MAGSKSRSKKTMEEQFEHILKKLSNMEELITDLRGDNKSLSNQLEVITSDNKRIEKQLKDIKADNKSLIGRMNAVETDMKCKELLIKELENKVEVLESKADDQEQYTKRDNILIHGLKILKPFNRVSDPEQQQISDDQELSEPHEEWSTWDKTIMRANIISFAKEKLKVELITEDILDVHTLPVCDNDSKGVCIVRFTNRLARDRFYQARRELKPENTVQNQKKIEGIFLNEHLTSRNAALFREARMLKKANKIRHVWTKNCRVLVRLLDGNVKQVRNHDCFSQFEKQTL